MTSVTSGKRSRARSQWTFLTNHAHVLVALARDPNARVRDLAEMVDITERAVQQILTDLEQAGALTRIRDGRRNRYSIDRKAPLRHTNEAGGCVGDLLALVEKNHQLLVPPAADGAAPERPLNT